MHTRQCTSCVCAVSLWAAMGAARAQTATETVIPAFGNYPQGGGPEGALVRDSSGNLYGTASYGGAGGYGVVFELTSHGMKVLYSFKGGTTDGAQPRAGVTFDSAGNLYGTTNQGGPANAGVVYKLSPAGGETVLYSFTGGADGGNPYAGAILDSADNPYGTTYNGGTAKLGVVYKVDPSGHETVLHSFTGTPSDGANPYAGVVVDADGNLYGTTYNDGEYNEGTVYKLSPAGQETILYNFRPNDTGSHPESGVILDAAGNLYGTAFDVIYELQANGTYEVLKTLPIDATGGEAASGVVRDSAGNLYGTTVQDGTEGARLGAVYKLDTAGQLTLLHVFTRTTEGAYPYGGVILDPSGNLYGTAAGDGTASAGVVYEVSASGEETTLFDFSPASGGTTPWTGVIPGPSGNLYGTTFWGGAANHGVAFKVSRAGRETVLYSFTGGSDGSGPMGGLALDSAGNLYGTTTAGGAGRHGVVYEVGPSGNEAVLYTFTGGLDGDAPNGVFRDAAGDLYGTAYGGGGSNAGVVFKVDPGGRETVLYAFTGGSDGGNPYAGVIADSAGNLYGTTTAGGPANVGVVYMVDPGGNETVLCSFTGLGADGGLPHGGVIRDSAGNLYGTTAAGGAWGQGQQGEGVVFKLDPGGNYSAIYTFTGGADGGGPLAGVVRDSGGNLYGTTSGGGMSNCDFGCGVVFELDASGQETVLHSFTGGADGSVPYVGVILDSAGSLLGTASAGGTGAGGVVYELALQ